MKRHLLRTQFMAATAALAALSQAHFIWGVYDPANPGRVTFDLVEEPGEKSLPQLKPNFENLKAWCDGKPISLTYQQTSLAGTTSAPQPAYGVLDYGVLAREGDPFLLTYYAKAARNFDEAATKVGTGMEVIATRHGENIMAVVLLNGEPAVDAQAFIHGPNGLLVDSTDEEGRLEFTQPMHGTLGIRVRVIEEKEGEQNGTAYSESRSYATLSVPLDAYGIPTGRLEAKEMLRRASSMRCNMPENLRAIEGFFSLRSSAGSAEGTFSWSPLTSDVDVSGLPEEDTAWAGAQIRSLFTHRQARPFEEGDGKYEIKLDEWNPVLGHLVSLDDTFKSAYRVRDNQVVQVNRVMGGERLLINIIENIRTRDGKVLPKHFNVVYHDGETGAILRTQNFYDEYREVEGTWLPVSRRMVEVKGRETIVREIIFHDLSTEFKN